MHEKAPLRHQLRNDVYCLTCLTCPSITRHHYARQQHFNNEVGYCSPNIRFSQHNEINILSNTVAPSIPTLSLEPYCDLRSEQRENQLHRNVK